MWFQNPHAVCPHRYPPPSFPAALLAVVSRWFWQINAVARHRLHSLNHVQNNAVVALYVYMCLLVLFGVVGSGQVFGEIYTCLGVIGEPTSIGWT